MLENSKSSDVVVFFFFLLFSRVGLDVFANVIQCKSLPGVTTRHNDIDIVIIRENTEGEYSSLEHEVIILVSQFDLKKKKKKSHTVDKDLGNVRRLFESQG